MKIKSSKLFFIFVVILCIILYLIFVKIKKDRGVNNITKNDETNLEELGLNKDSVLRKALSKSSWSLPFKVYFYFGEYKKSKSKYKFKIINDLDTFVIVFKNILYNDFKNKVPPIKSLNIEIFNKKDLSIFKRTYEINELQKTNWFEPFLSFSFPEKNLIADIGLNNKDEYLLIY